MSEPVLAVIPARLESSRLIRKPLYMILGRPLLEWVWIRVSTMSVFDRIVIATDSGEVAALCERMGAPVLLTDQGHPSGTDRVAEVVRSPGFAEFPVVVNVQGDEPLVEEKHLRAAIDLVREGDWDVGTCATPIGDVESFSDPAVVKVARGLDGRALYFSRAGIPHLRDGELTPDLLDGPPFLRHLGIYAYTREALLRWVALPPSPLENTERLEQLRALEAGIGIGVAVVRGAGPGVDTQADAKRVGKLLATADTTMMTTEGT